MHRIIYYHCSDTLTLLFIVFAVLLSVARIPHHQLSCYVDSVLSPGPESLILWARRDSDIGHLGKYGLEMTGLILTLDSRTQSVQVERT